MPSPIPCLSVVSFSAAGAASSRERANSSCCLDDVDDRGPPPRGEVPLSCLIGLVPKISLSGSLVALPGCGSPLQRGEKPDFHKNTWIFAAEPLYKKEFFLFLKLWHLSRRIAETIEHGNHLS